MTPKQLSFVSHKLEGLSNRAAVIAAGYSPAGAKQTGTYLMKHPAVHAALKDRGYNFVSAKSFVRASFKRAASEWKAVSESMPKKVYDCPVEFLTDAMNCQALPIQVRVEFGAVLLPYQFQKAR